MPATKSFASDASSRAGNTVSDFMRRIGYDFSNILGSNNSCTDDSSCDDDFIFDPIDFNSPQHSKKNLHREEDSAWLFSGNELTAIDNCAYNEGEVGVDLNLGIESVPAYLNQFDQISERRRELSHKNNRRPAPRKYRRTKQVYCDKTTYRLAILCFLLTIILATLLFVGRPFRKNSTNGVAENSNFVFTAPTQSPVNIGAITSSFPISEPIVTTQEPIADATYKPIATRPVSKPSTRPTSPVSVHSRTARPTLSPTKKEFVTPRAPPLTAASDKKDEEITTDSAQAAARQPTEVPPLSMGPMVGHTTHDSVTLWAYHAFEDYTMEILLYDSVTNGLIRTIDLVAPRKDRNNAMIETITGLAPSTSYKFGMHINGHRVGKGSFATAPLPQQSAKFDYILASCMNYRQYKNQIVWKEIVDNNAGKFPDFSILAGDTVYLQEGVDVTVRDGVIFERLWFRNKEQRNEKHFSEFIGNTPTYATWNDHEYGSNNANRNQKGKNNSLRAWEALWANPGYGEEGSNDGVYFSYYWGDVHYLITDDHWYRDPAAGNRLGQKQTMWLREELKNSNGTFKIIVIGSDIMERDWTSDLNNIGDIVRENKIDGVLFHAGDIHRNEFKQMETGGFPYPVTQITSSGIAKVWRRPYVHIEIDTTVDDPFIDAHFYGASSTADKTTWTNDSNLRCTSIVEEDRSKEHTCTETIRLSDLRAM